MENIYLQELIARVEREVDEHQREHYNGNDVHDEDKIISIDTSAQACSEESSLDFSPSKKAPIVAKRQTVRGDEFEGAQLLDKLACQLDQKGKCLEAQHTRDRAQA